MVPSYLSRVITGPDKSINWDGSIYAGNSFLYETEHKQKFLRGHLDDLENFDTYWLDRPENAELLRWSYPPEVMANNLKVGAIFKSFLVWMHSSAAPEKRTGI